MLHTIKKIRVKEILDTKVIPKKLGQLLDRGKKNNKTKKKIKTRNEKQK